MTDEQRFLAEVIRDLLKFPGDIPEGEIVHRLIAKGLRMERAVAVVESIHQFEDTDERGTPPAGLNRE
ncbi:MAG: hypothetical protein JWN70_2902 [Planctomycetaceae bacterium]|nr:hypothetical protein [Planctomycetaceae bacterium]